MRVIFMGSAALSCPSLEALADAEQVVGVVTQPDRPSGRGRKIVAGPVRELAGRRGLAVLTPAGVNDAASVTALREIAPDLIVVVAYGQILGEELLRLPPLGAVNVHASLLPKYRGAAPIQWAVANGERVTGVTTMFMERGVDTGDIILQKEAAIGPDETCASLQGRLAAAGAGLLTQTLKLLRDGNARRIPQDDAQASYAPRLRKADGRIDWTMPAARIYDRIRGFNPWPGCFCRRQGGAGLAVLSARVEDATTGAQPGEVVDTAGAGPAVATGRGVLRLLEVRPEGGKAMTGDAYLRGYRLRIGEKLEEASGPRRP